MKCEVKDCNTKEEAKVQGFMGVIVCDPHLRDALESEGYRKAYTEYDAHDTRKLAFIEAGNVDEAEKEARLAQEYLDKSRVAARAWCNLPKAWQKRAAPHNELTCGVCNNPACDTPNGKH